MRRFLRAPVALSPSVSSLSGTRAFAAPAKKTAKKGGGGGGGAAGATGGPGDFPVDEMYKELNLHELKRSDVPQWAVDDVKLVFGPAQPETPVLPGQETKKTFKELRRQRIKENNERKGMGL